jgi:zinc/manganese transport system permease protein
VRIAGVLLVFSYLIVPAVIGAWLADSIGRRLMIGWSIGLVVSAAGLGASYALDLPTGATIVAAFGAVLAGVALAVGVARAIQAVRREGARALAGLGIVFGGVILTAGVMLAAFPAADHPWLDALERAVPAMQDAFLTPYERRVAADSRTFIARADAELGRLRALAVDVQWGRATLPDEQRERLRQFIAGRSEIAAGDRMVLRTLARHARERQRWALGLPMAAVGGALAVLGARAGRRRAAPRPPAAISGETRAAR